MIRWLDIDFFTEVWHTITKNKGRSVLTAFGVFWGILIFVLLKGAGDGIERKLYSLFSDQARNFVIVIPTNTTEPYQGFQRGRVPEFRSGDLAAVKNKIPDISMALPVVFAPWGEDNTVRHSDETFSPDVFVGINQDMMVLSPPLLSEGRFINDMDCREVRKVCLIGEQVRNALYKHGETAVGSTIWVGSGAYKVIGVVNDKNNATMLFNYAKGVFVPYTTVQKIYGMADRITYAGIGLPPDDSGLKDELETFLKERMHISPTDRGGMFIMSTKEIFDQFSAFFAAINFLTYLVGLGTLLCGMVGVCNIMLVTVRERTQEIGVKRALGATPAEIIRQVMTESLVLALIAGLVGIVVGVGLLTAAEFVLQRMSDPPLDNVQLQLSSALSAVAIISIMGMLAGLLPSYRAIKIKAIDALRDE